MDTRLVVVIFACLGCCLVFADNEILAQILQKLQIIEERLETVKKSNQLKVTAYNTSGLEERVTELEDSVADLHNRVITVENTTEYLVTFAENTDVRLDPLETNAIGLDIRLTSVESATDELSDQIISLQSADEAIELRLEALESETNDTIGFHAQLDTTIVSVGTIEFGNELADIGGGYDSTSGIFTAPRDGLYYFYFYLEVLVGSFTYGRLYKNSVIQCVAEGGSLSPDQMMISCGAVMELVMGDEVYVTNSGMDPFESPESCGFTGFLIQAYV